jgi:hypothetical protein
MKENAAISVNGARVSVETKTGDTFSFEVSDARGSLVNPLSDEEIQAKFDMLTAGAVLPERAAALADLIWQLEDIDDAAKIMTLTRP